MRGGLRPPPQRGRAPSAPAPFVYSFLYLPRSCVEAPGLSCIFLSCFLLFGAQGVEAGGFLGCRGRLDSCPPAAAGEIQKMNTQRGRAPKAPAPFVGAAEGRSSFLYLPGWGVEARGFFLHFFVVFPALSGLRCRGWRVLRLFAAPGCRGLHTLCTFSALFWHMSF